MRAPATEPQRAAEAVALRAAALAQVALAAGRAFVERVGDEFAQAFQFGGQHSVGGRGGDVAQAVGALLAGVRAVAAAAGEHRAHADGAVRAAASAGLRTVTGTVTDGRTGGRRGTRTHGVSLH